MRKQARLDWLMEYFKNHADETFDVLNAEFVDAYAEATSSKLNYQMFGAHKCSQLGKDLSQLHKDQFLSRHAVGIGDGLSGQGFPKWVYCYKLSAYYKHLLS